MLFWGELLVAQQSAEEEYHSAIEKLMTIEPKQLGKLQKRLEKLEESVTRESLRILNKANKSENLLLAQLKRNDSLVAKSMNVSANLFYARIRKNITEGENSENYQPITTYLPSVDTLQTILKFLEGKTKLVDQNANYRKTGLTLLGKRLAAIQGKMSSSNELKLLLRERNEIWKNQLSKLTSVAAYKKLNRDIYNFQTRLKNYKAILNDPKMWDEQLFEIARNIPAFSAFMQKNSQLSALFNLPGPTLVNGNSQVPGMQTRQMVQNQLNQLIQGVNNSPQQYIQQQLGVANSELNKLKERVNNVGGNSDELAMPEGFKPNGQKTKSFLHRIELGMNIQSQRSNSILPAITDIALQVGYKLNDKSSVGVGVAYKLGWGKDISHMSFSSEGVGLRSYLDIKLKKNIWVMGGYEMNHNDRFDGLPELKNLASWQESGLVGLSKKYSIGKKRGNIQLLWDFLSYTRTPTTPAIKFRLGYML